MMRITSELGSFVSKFVDVSLSVAPSVISSLSDPNEKRKLSSEPILEENVAIVCVHGSRDSRCEGGRVVADEIAKIAKKLNLSEEVSVKVSTLTEKVLVLRSSHVGGHKHAPNVVFYPSMHWYGRVEVDKVEDLLLCELDGGTYRQYFRGVPGMKREEAYEALKTCMMQDLEVN